MVIDWPMVIWGTFNKCNKYTFSLIQNYYENRSLQKKRETSKLKNKGQEAEYPFFNVIDIDLRYS